MKKVISFVCFLIIALSCMVATKNLTIYADSSIENEIKSNYYILYHPESKKVLLAHGENEKTPVASICKLMTSLLVLDSIGSGRLSLDDKLVASEYACSVEGSQAFLDAGSEYSVRDLLKSVIVASANDSAIVLAEGVSGTESEFVKLMNLKALELGMSNTKYENSTGLFTSGQYSTAKDTLKVLQAVSSYDIYNEDCHIWMDKLVHPSGRVTELVNTNRLIKYYDYCLNGKTGYVDEAGYCLASSAKKDDMKLMAVVLGGSKATTRFEDSVKLYSYGFANYYNKQILFNDKPLNDAISVSGGKENIALVKPKFNYYAICKKGEDCAVNLVFDIQEKIKAPMQKDQEVGRIIITENNFVLAEIPVILCGDVLKQNYGDALDKVVSNWKL